MPGLVRLSMSLERELHDRLEEMLRDGSYSSRSDLFRDLIRSREVERQWERDGESLGTITLVYDHDDRTLARKLTKAQHHHHGAVMATTHVHLDENLCAEMIMVRGRASEIRHLADELGHQRGVLHSALSMSSAGASKGAGNGHTHPHDHAHPHTLAPRRGGKGH